VDITTFFPELVDNMRQTLWLHWERCAIGFVSSPYIAVQENLLQKRFSEAIILMQTTFSDGM